MTESSSGRCTSPTARRPGTTSLLHWTSPKASPPSGATSASRGKIANTSSSTPANSTSTAPQRPRLRCLSKVSSSINRCIWENCGWTIMAVCSSSEDAAPPCPPAPAPPLSPLPITKAGTTTSAMVRCTLRSSSGTAVPPWRQTAPGWWWRPPTSATHITPIVTMYDIMVNVFIIRRLPQAKIPSFSEHIYPILDRFSPSPMGQ